MGKTVLHRIVEASPLVPKTKTMYLHDLDQWVAFAGDDPKGWDRYKAQEFYNALLTRMQPQSANRLFGGVAYAAKWWATKEGNPQLDFAVVQKTKASGKQQRYALKPDEAIKLLQTCHRGLPNDRRDLAMIVTGLETGMRCMSIARSTIENIGTEKNYKFPVLAVPIKGKGVDYYDVPLSDLAIEAIAPWRAWLRSVGIVGGPLYRGIAMMNTQGRYVVNPNHLSETAIYKIIVKRGELAGLGHIHPHLLRHTFVTWRADVGFQPHEIASITGHEISGLPGMSGLGHYYDAAKVGSEARRATPPWLKEAVETLLAPF